MMPFYNPVPAARCTGLIIYLPPPTGLHHTPLPILLFKLYAKISSSSKVHFIQRVSKGSINELISIVMGSLPFELLEIYEAINRKERSNGRG